MKFTLGVLPMLAVFSATAFADGRAEVHKFKSSVITKAPVNWTAAVLMLPQTGTAANGLVTDIGWLADNTTVKR
jgi:hypothetical protein